ncbi:aspartyl/asparaginyl beta-hydroxylase isoform X1 [Anoplophora glabripennis]|uniref:aspartyl/asparaginyl beta-hydroxylase isoform X1 n=1 Tax=Anoplophora glabripennis TaxID=217634 RepID=UPI000874649A|nr:aspartyl/asparaginyl beta-hydroxylase isoform X1 [Anoplophora glabripennis]XP_018578911.1 aspartyl/asparaginyl beta-hydroxylase isoform X1 [Anoplophora glabripennis]
MSGDVQPRKRKDKKRRKDEGEQIPIQTHAPLHTNSSNDDVNIHVHKESGTGGGICAKLVFFVLLSALAVVIGMIITQYRGLTDVETVDTESRFSQIFEGWIDSSPDHHDDHDIEEALDQELDHDEENDEHNASEDDDEEDEEHEPSEEEDDEESNEDTEVSEEMNEVDEDDDDNLDEDEEEAVEESEENQLDDDEEDEDVQASEEEGDKSEEKDDDEDEEDEDDDEQDHDEDEQELENIESDEDKDEDNVDEVSTERKSGEDNEDQQADDDEDEDDAKTQKTPDTAKRVSTDIADDDTPSKEKQQESSGMAVKLGVGVALLVVAHLVLVRKWRTAPDDKPKPPKEEPTEPAPNLNRRNTIVMPPTFQEVEPDMEPEEEDYSEEEELSEEEVHEIKSAKARYQELRSTYTRSLTPEGEIDYHKPPETYDDEYEENVDDEEDEEVSEEEEDDDKQEGESEEEEDDYDEDEDEELLKRLEAKYGKLRQGTAERQADVENSDSEKSDDGTGYQFSNITNKDDYKIKSKIDEAQKSVQDNSAYAIELFDKILQKYPSSPRSIYGKALSLDYLADQRRSNDILQQALKFYMQLLNTEHVPKALFEVAAERCINRMRFVGQYRNAINVHKLLVHKFPDNPKHSNNLAVTYLTINRVEEARSVLKKILEKWPNDGLALVHYGFILKTVDNKLEGAVDYLRRGLETRAEGVIDGRFYFHLGDALARLGQHEEAMKVYEEGVENNVFLSKYQRSLYNVPRLTGKPWWDLTDLPYLDLYRLLKQNWQKIRDEGLAVLNEKGYFQDESENLKDTGDWKQFELFARGQKNLKNCMVCPFTCSIIERVPEARSCKRGQTKFSVMHPGTHVWPHCGPTNCRLRAHLGLKVPPKTFIRVADDTRSWEEGGIFVFDDSFEHEVWHNGTEFRLVLIVDVWHPELTTAERRNLSPI